MLATVAITETRDLRLRCGACRYFQQDRCGNTMARLDGEDVKTGECPYFRFVQNF